MTENKKFRTGKGIFKGDYFSGAIIDEETRERYYDGIKPSYISSKELVKILNELYNENEQLKQKIKSIHEILSKDIGYIESLRKIEEALK